MFGWKWALSFLCCRRLSGLAVFVYADSLPPLGWTRNVGADLVVTAYSISQRSGQPDSTHLRRFVIGGLGHCASVDTTAGSCFIWPLC